MRSLTLLGVIGLLMITVLTGCVSHSENILPGTPHETAGLTLNVMPDTFVGGAEVGDLKLDVTDLGDSLMVDVTATNATNLKALYFELDYDKTQLRPMTVDATDKLGDSNDLISLQIFREQGVVHYAQILTHHDLRVGFSGDGVLATVLFKKEPALNTRLVSAAPMEPISAQIVDTDVSANISWWYTNQGDYDQNMEVGMSDLTPIASFFGEYVAPDKFPIDSNFAMVDGDANGEIGMSDITPIAINFAATASEFHIYSSSVAGDYPYGGAIVQMSASDGIVPFADGAPAAAGRLKFSVPVADIDGFTENDWFWVFPADQTPSLGYVSNLVGGVNVDRAIIDLPVEPAVGDGLSFGTAYKVDDVTDYVFTLTHPTDGDVTNDANTLYLVSDGAAGSINTADATLNISDGYTGTFSVSATYNTIPSETPAIWMSVDVDDPAGLFIMQDPADAADWAGVTGTGAADTDPYILGVTGGFNADWSTEFSMVANTKEDGTGDVILNGDLDWYAFPPFVVDWTGAGTFEANMFTGQHIFAQDKVTSDNSNKVYVIHQSLPDDTP